MLSPDVQHEWLTRLRPVLIVGMHRSGTSCLAGCLEELGLRMGNVITTSPFNAKGNRENPATWPIHDAMLGRVGASWDSPPAGAVPWSPEDIAAATCLLHSYRELPEPWGFKDPRSTLLLDGWFSLVPRLRLVASVRHPVAVARSLAARNGFAEERSFALWERYNREVLRWHSLLGFAVIDYDDPDYEQKVRRVSAGFGLGGDLPLTFRSAELNHHAGGEQLPSDIAAMWAELKEVAE